MILTAKQEQGLKIAVDRYKNGNPWTCISGYAGTGKSTLVKFIIQALGIYPEDVTYISYTGKAALVLQEKGCPNAMTAHRLLYYARRRKDGTFYFIPRKVLEHRYALIVVDEVSMLPKPIWELLLSHRIPIIALGDPFQLPPLGEDNRVLEHPHIFLDEIMRQAKESEIIRLTMDIRQGVPLKTFNGEEVKVLNKNQMTDGMFLWADQILCGKNSTRHKLNNLYRKTFLQTTNNIPIDGDKIICLHNDYKIGSELNESPLINGMVGTLKNIEYLPGIGNYIKKRMIGDLIIDDDMFAELEMDYKIFTEGKNTVNKDNFKKIPVKLIEFDYGYAITYWKAQGSEWDNVLVLEENWPPKNTEEHQRAIYTAATRARNKLVIIKNYL